MQTEEMHVISEKDIESNVYVSEKKKIAKVMKDLEESYKKGLISKDAYLRAKNQMEEKLKVVEEREKSIKVEEERKGKKIKEKAEKTQNVSSSSISYIKKKHIEELKKMKENWINDLNSLKSLYDHGIISEEEYERGKEDIEEKIERIEEIIKKELELEEIEELKNRIEKEIKEAFSKGIFKEEESKLKEDLKALESLYNRGLISKKDYEEKKAAIEKELENYTKLIELIDAIFEKFIEDINKKIETNREATKEKEKIEEVEKIEEKKPKKIPAILKILSKLGLYELEKNVKEEKSKIILELEKAYKEGEQRFRISNIALVIKKEIKNILGIEKALTYSEIIDEVEKSNKFDETLKAKIKSFFQNVMVKEYLEEEDEKDIESVYKEALELGQLLEKVEKGKGRKDHKEEKEIRKTQSANEKEEKVESADKMVEEKEKKKSIFDRINEFFGV